MREFNRKDFERAEKRLDLLEGSIEQEISDRVTETDAKIGATQETLTRKCANGNFVKPAERIRRRCRHAHRGGEEHHEDGRRHQVQAAQEDRRRAHRQESKVRRIQRLNARPTQASAQVRRGVPNRINERVHAL